MSDEGDDERIAVQLAEEHATIGKRTVTTGRVTVRTRTELRHETVDEELTGQTVGVKRVPRNVVVEAAPEVRIEGDATILPVLEERLIVTKQLVLVEEVHVVKRTNVETVQIPIDIRKQVIDVEEQST